MIDKPKKRKPLVVWIAMARNKTTGHMTFFGESFYTREHHARATAQSLKAYGLEFTPTKFMEVP